MASTNKTVKVLTVHNVMGERQSFNSKNYSWTLDQLLLTVTRNDGKWHAYFPMANVVKAEVEELRK